MTESSSSLREHIRAAHDTALVVDETAAFGALVVRGGDRKTWLNGLVTCDMNKLAKDRPLYGLAVTPKGRVLADMVIVEDGEHLLVLLPMSEVGSIAATFEHYLVMEDAELEPAPDAYRVFFVHGPKSALVLERAKDAGGTVGVLDFLGLGGGVVVAHASVGDAVREALLAAVRQVGGAVGDAVSADALRMEQGAPRFGRDFGPSTYPQEAGLEQRAVSFDKGCYLGQEVVCMLQLRGHVKRKLVSLVVDEGSASPGVALTSADGQTVGELTSVADSPSQGRPVALGMVKLAFATAGTELRVGEARAHVISTPLLAC